MSVPRWKERLAAGIEASGRSHRDISIAAGKGAGYVHSILNEGKDPTISNLISLCNELKISVLHILAGFDITPEKEEFLRLLDQSDEETQKAVLLLLGRGARPS